MSKKKDLEKEKSQKTVLIKHSTILIAYLLIVWGFYRFLFKLPEEVEELFIKPILWLVPVFYFVRKEGRGLSSLGITSKNLFESIYLSLALGLVFAIEGLVVNFIKYEGLLFGANIGEKALLVSLGLSLATAISEEITFRGFLFGRIWSVLKSEWRANLVTSFFWALIHIPIAVFWWQLGFPETLGFMILTTIFGIGSAFVFARTKNIFSSILLHVLWQWPITLFR